MAKTYLVTGTNRGIGLELTRQLLDRGNTVVGTARHPEKAAELKNLAEAHPKACTIEALDVASDDSVNACVARLEGRAIDVLVNNAAVLLDPGMPLASTPLDVAVQTFDVNAVGQMRVARAMLPLLERAEAPIVANISSDAGSIAENSMKTMYGYCMSKAALNMFTTMMAREYPDVICVSLHPGWVKTDMGGKDALLEPDASATGLCDVIGKLTRAHSGRFFDYQGNELPW